MWLMCLFAVLTNVSYALNRSPPPSETAAARPCPCVHSAPHHWQLTTPGPHSSHRRDKSNHSEPRPLTAHNLWHLSFKSWPWSDVLMANSAHKEGLKSLSTLSRKHSVSSVLFLFLIYSWIACHNALVKVKIVMYVKDSFQYSGGHTPRSILWVMNYNVYNESLNSTN